MSNVLRFPALLLFAVILLIKSEVSAHAVDENQVCNAETAKVGQWTMQLHLNNALAKSPGACARCHRRWRRWWWDRSVRPTRRGQSGRSRQCRTDSPFP